jgi:hypothetical protein
MPKTDKIGLNFFIQGLRLKVNVSTFNLNPSKLLHGAIALAITRDLNPNQCASLQHNLLYIYIYIYIYRYIYSRSYIS